MDLHYIDGSPFARVLRVLLREHALPVTLHEITAFPPPPDLMALNPMGHVPVLIRDGVARFPTQIAITTLLSGVTSATVATAIARPAQALDDEQTLAVIFAMGDALVAHHYLDWAGYGPVTRNRLGFSPPGRNMLRVTTTLDWLEARIGADGFQPGILSVQDIALACLLLWAESRGPIAWRGRPKIEALVARLRTRPSFSATEPRPHQLD